MTSTPANASEEPMSGCVLSLGKDDLARFCVEHGYPPFRARQIWRWLYARRAGDWQSMKNLPAMLRDRLARTFTLNPAAVPRMEGARSSTRKFLIGLRDGHRVESVLIPAGRRRTVCVSTQVGCRFRCAFCASGQAGFLRNLEAGEIVGQVLLAARESGSRPTHVVYMGVGEPFDNYDEVIKSVRIVNDPDGLAVGARRITISTSGVIPGIERLAGENLQVELSVSLHAARSDLRAELMPVNRLYPLPSLIEACRRYSKTTGRIITFEYTLIRGVNDSRQDAANLAALLKDLPCRVNLLLLSPIAEFDGRPPLRRAAAMFTATLAGRRLNATLRESKGCAINAACGQLRFRSCVFPRLL
ncbi:MAG: 23S rRNA (adenine(2503)-C(2))-methyltransferase RlmN [Verrucomicrobiota bacterium]|nr:23S rRNA (adenine(2503)-C(2))-methyltransferase RlmN [Verrucomicrobiota bacterium]